MAIAARDTPSPPSRRYRARMTEDVAPAAYCVLHHFVRCKSARGPKMLRGAASAASVAQRSFARTPHPGPVTPSHVPESTCVRNEQSNMVRPRPITRARRSTTSQPSRRTVRVTTRRRRTRHTARARMRRRRASTPTRPRRSTRRTTACRPLRPARCTTIMRRRSSVRVTRSSTTLVARSRRRCVARKTASATSRARRCIRGGSRSGPSSRRSLQRKSGSNPRTSRRRRFSCSARPCCSGASRSKTPARSAGRRCRIEVDSSPSGRGNPMAAGCFSG